jgi:hypothetical protein
MAASRYGTMLVCPWSAKENGGVKVPVRYSVIMSSIILLKGPKLEIFVAVFFFPNPSLDG